MVSTKRILDRVLYKLSYVRTLPNDKAFGQENEGKLVKNLRKNEKYISDLSLIAEVDNKIVGHILFFPIKVISQKNEYERFLNWKEARK